MDILARTFTIGFLLSTPIIISIFLLDLVLGILTRTIPQLNIFVVGLPLKVFVGLLLMLVTVPIFGTIVSNLMSLMSEKIYELFRM